MEEKSGFTVHIRIREEADLYNDFDPSGETLSGELCDYFESTLKERRLGECMHLHIVSENDIDHERLRTAIRRYSEKKALVQRRERKAYQLNAIRMFGIGIFFVLLGIFLHGQFGTVVTTVIETLGSFSIWEAANVWLEEMPKLRLKDRMARFLRDPEVEIEIKKIRDR